MDKIPPEILCQIFATEPLLASQVSHKWRTILTSDPRIWTSPSLTITATTSFARLQLLSLCLKRSSTQPLHITLTMDPFAATPSKTHIVAVAAFALLIEHAARWRSLTLTLPAADGLFSTFCACLSTASPAHLLQTAHITLGSWTAASGGAAVRKLLSRAPVLEDLRWSNRAAWSAWDTPFASGVAALGANDGCTRLTRLVLETFVTPNGALAILAQASRLESLELAHLGSPPADTNGDGWASDDSAALEHLPALAQHTPTAPLRAPALRSLSIYQLTLDSALPTLLARLACPVLAHLALTCGFLPSDGQPGAAGAALVRFVAQTCIETLVLEGMGIAPAHLGACLSAAPALRRLDAYDGRGGACIDDALLTALSARDADTEIPVLCPGLRELVLHGAVECADGALAEMLSARAARLHEVEVVFAKRGLVENARDVAYLQALRLGA